LANTKIKKTGWIRVMSEPKKEQWDIGQNQHRRAPAKSAWIEKGDAKTDKYTRPLFVVCDKCQQLVPFNNQCDAPAQG
jgi:hypothetical protein